MLALMVQPLVAEEDIEKQSSATYTIEKGKVLRKFSIKENSEGKYVAYLVKWRDYEVVIQDPFASSDDNVGDEISFIVYETVLEEGDKSTSVLNFAYLNEDGITAAKNLREAEAKLPSFRGNPKDLRNDLRDLEKRIEELKKR